ncbi:NAD(P)/FAD-dependent oxidoreductase [Peptacetobacter sp.]|uniref:NAD(P)/FAD-dependent oxidoreductase n=1 Tax=Peptacetobacter sp. TaxID=2991975 RepID=UPI00262A87BB|nr:NAD(P)/FAD-dependent oxidoreductase [Peptacetobacter sp.]
MAKIVIVGGGAAGMMAAISASQNSKNEVFLLERNGELGRKIKLTGGGRCNLTNAREIDDFFEKVVTNKRFLYSSFDAFSNKDLLEFFDRIGLKYKIEKDNDFKVYTENDRAEELIDSLNKELLKRDVKILYNKKVVDLEINMFPKEEILSKKDKIGEVKGVILDNGDRIDCDKLVLTTGGRSFSSTGSDGNMYKILKKYGHKILPPIPALVPLKIEESWIMNMQGISLKDVEISCKIKKKKLKQNGDIIFTHFGISGPAVLILSSYINKTLENENVELSIDFLPNSTREDISEAIREFPNRNVITNLKGILPQNFLKAIAQQAGVYEMKVNELPKKLENKIISLIKEMKLTSTSTLGIEPAIVTSGGVSVKDINSTTMESKKIKNLHVAGEILDVDAETGGYNLQIAFSTGFAAGKSEF